MGKDIGKKVKASYDKLGHKIDIKGALAEADKKAKAAVEKAKAAPIVDRVNELKVRAKKEGVEFSADIEKALLACKTGGEVRRAWKSHRQKVEQPQT